MSLRALLATCVLSLAALSAAADYDLVVPQGWDYLKTAKTLVVYSPTGLIKPGDHIKRVVVGGADGQEVRISSGWSTGSEVELSKSGTATGYPGSIILSTDNTGANGLSATLVPAGVGATRPAKEGIAGAFPWIWVLGGLGVVVVLSGLSTLLRRPGPAGAPQRFTGRKGVEEGVREIRAKIEEIQNDQRELVKKPPVLRSFRKQIESFEHRLRDIESSSEETFQQLSVIAGTLTRLEERLGNLAQHAVSASTDSKKAIELVGKLSSEQSAQTSQLQEQIRKVAAGQEGIGLISRDVAKTADSVANLASRIDSVAAQNLAQETRIQAVSTALDSTKKQLEGLATAESVSATHSGLSKLTAIAQSTDQRLAGLEAQASASAGRDEETRAQIQNVASSVEQGLARLDSRVELVSKTTEGLHQSLLEIQGRVSNTEGSLHENLQGLASQLGTLRTEVGSLPQAMSSLGDRVGSLDARLAPLSERGDLLAESFQGLQARFEEAAQNLATQVQSMEGRLEEIRTDGSKLANLPEVALELHGNTAELTEHVRSAESGLKSLGEELAKLQQAMLSDSKQSDAFADELAQRLEAWEGALANVASKVDDLRAPAAPEPIVTLEEAEPESVELQLVETLAQETKLESEAEPVTVEVAADPEPELQPEIQPEPEPEAEIEPEVVAPEAPAAELEIREDEDLDDEGFVLEKSKAGRWAGMGGSSERTWSTKMPSAKTLPSVKGPIRPLTPIETPSVDSQLGALICTGQGAAYAHGDSLRCFWPGTENRSVALQSPLPNDLWRVMLFGGYLYCVEERQVEVVHMSTWTKHATFQGDYLCQAHTDSHWVGLMAWGEKLAIDFRDSLGAHIGTPREIDASASDSYYLAAAGNAAYVGTRSGSVFRVEPAGVVQLCRPSDDSKLLSLTVTKAGLLLMIQGENGLAARLIGKDGHLLKEADMGCQVLAHAPVVMGDRFYVFDDCLGELLTVNLKSLQIGSRMALESTLGIGRMLGLVCGKNHLLAILAADDRGQCTRAFVLDPKTGQEMTLCPINHPRAEMVAGDGHLIIATSSAYQNTIQVFDPFDAVEAKARRAA